MKENSLTNLLFEQFKFRVFEESIPRIENCLDRLSTEQIWYKPNENSNSIGNLILHLEGNVRQWILTGLYQMKETRNRPLEFNSTEKKEAEWLKAHLKKLKNDINGCITNKPLPDLRLTNSVQGFQENGVSILTHVIEHFSYHTGQIALLSKILVNEDLGFYENIKLH